MRLKEKEKEKKVIPVGRRSSSVLQCVCFVFSSHLFWTSGLWTYHSRSHTGGRSHRISRPPSFCGACLHFSREKDTAVAFPRRPRSRISCTYDLIVLHLLGIFFFSFCVRKINSCRDSNSRPTVSEGFEVTN